MTDRRFKSEQHPLAPEEAVDEAEANDRTAVRMRGGVTTGSMRWVLGIGLVLAILGLVVVWGLTPTS